MATALESASLVMIPSGYEEGTLGSLQPLDGSGDFTFSRGSNLSATRVKQDGYIEKGYENLLLQSNQFDSTWASVRVSESTGFAGYDGANNAWKIVPNTQLGDHRLDQSTSVSGVWTFNIYAKAAGYNFLYILFSGIGNSGKVIDISPNQGVVVDNKGGVQAIDESITDVGNDWWKITLTYSGTLGTLRIIALPANDTSSYAGDGTSGILIQDAQVNQGLVAYPYLETTTTSVKGGILENTPRIDYTGGGAGSLLLEPSRTNEILYSEYFDAWNQISSPTITTNYGISPEGIQNSTRFQTSVGRLTQNVITINANETFSVYMKGSGTLRIQIGSENFYPSVTSEWIRYEFTSTQAGAISSVQIRGNGAAVDVELYGAQYERNTYPTSYIPTYGTSQTRADENSAIELSVLDFFSLGTSESGTFFIETKYVNAESNNRVTTFSQGGSGNNLWTNDNFQIRNTEGSDYFLVQNINDVIDNYIKIIIRKNGTTYNVFVNGTKSSTTATITNPLRWFEYIALWENKQMLKQMIEFPTALTDSECIALTTI